MAASQRLAFREALSGLFLPDAADTFGGALKISHPELDLLWPPGTGDNQADRWWADVARTIATAATDALDLKALSAGNSPSGAAVNLAEVRAILLYWRAANTTNLTIQPSAVNGWTGLGAGFEITLKPGSYLRLFDGLDGKYPTTGTDKSLDLINSAGATGTYDIVIVGASA